ncbi:amino acid adenylation domain-containing protein [Actinophytocola sp.]|uniref:amino acid adenylation domain-containing protein n=1 Tax=Actinophytocola sp. TaxID=1872138 RepID=UPI003D6B907F
MSGTVSQTIKCLIWDLDQTLWRGVLLEDGEVTVPDSVRATITELDARGVLQSVASRNDHDHAWERLEKLGLAEYFVLPMIGWGRKSDSVAEIAERLGFAHGVVAFVDDQPAERAEVAYHLPDIRCYPAEAVGSFLDLPEFSPATVTEDARQRRAMYQAGFRRDAERAEFTGADEEFLRSLGMVLRVQRAGEAELARVEELTLRTSQLNATGVHYSDADLRALLADPAHEVLVATLTDRFGPHGAIGVLLLEKHEPVWRLKLLATSCRVVSFGVGTVILHWLADQAAAAGTHLVADFRRTERNRMMEVAYRFAGFDDAPCDCRGSLPPAAEGGQHLHLTPSRHEPPVTMRVVAPTLHVRTLYQWFADSAERVGEEPALEVGDLVLSYRELRERAESLAARILREHGGPVRRVALLASRSLVAYAGYLAVQRLGATVVPLNPGYPAARNAMVCDQVVPDVLVADDAGAAQLADLPTGPTVLQLSDVDVSGSAGPPPYEPDPDGLAYILFTSGSTGVPKGVPIRHHQVFPYLERQIQRYEVGPGARTSHTFDLTFDPSLFDLFVTWGGGGTLVVPQRAELLRPVDYIIDRRITHWYSVPSVLSISATLGNRPDAVVTSLRYSIFVGEPLTQRQCRAWRAVAPNTVVENVYGPTELSVTCTAYALPAEPERWPVTSNDTVPIGAVDESLEYLILDEHGRPATEGELCIRGRQRFDGYLDPAENVGRFLRYRDGVESYAARGELTGEHYYRTGDRVRIEHGLWVHLGRSDNQVKVRGYRVELGEVEAAMLRHPDVLEAVAVALRRDEEVELVGVHTGAEIPAAEFMLWLRKRIPVHMVPRRYLRLDALPLNANGKADRRALAAELMEGAR